MRSGRIDWAVALTIGSLIVAAGWAMLFGLSEERCFTTPDGSGCGSGLLSVTGVAVEIGLIGVAIAIAAFAAARARGQARESEA